MSNKAEITLGCDPEVFLLDTRNYSYLSAAGRIGGTKEKPLELGGGTFIQEDGVCVEFNTPAVSKGPEAFFQQVRNSYKTVRNFVANKEPECELSIVSSAVFAPEQLASLQARTLGCDPDLRAHQRGFQRVPPTIEALGDVRCAGGHIHVGFDKNVMPKGWAMVQLIEAGAYFTLIQDFDMCQNDRKRFYGQAGLFRDKPYGIEYRTPPNAWIAGGVGPIFVERVYKVAKWVMENITKAKGLYEQLDFKRIESNINESNWANDYVGDVHELFEQAGAL